MVFHFDLFNEYILYKLDSDRYLSCKFHNSDPNFLTILKEHYDIDENLRKKQNFHYRSNPLGFQHFVHFVFSFYLEQPENISMNMDSETPNEEDLDAFISTIKAWEITPFRFIIKQINSNANGFVFITSEDMKTLGVDGWAESQSSETSQFSSTPNLFDENPQLPSSSTKTGIITGSQKRKRARFLKEVNLTSSDILAAKHLASIQKIMAFKAEHMIKNFFGTSYSIDILYFLNRLTQLEMGQSQSHNSTNLDNNSNTSQQSLNIEFTDSGKHLSIDQVKSLAAKQSEKLRLDILKSNKNNDNDIFEHLSETREALKTIVTNSQFLDEPTREKLNLAVDAKGAHGAKGATAEAVKNKISTDGDSKTKNLETGVQKGLNGATTGAQNTATTTAAAITTTNDKTTGSNTSLISGTSQLTGQSDIDKSQDLSTIKQMLLGGEKQQASSNGANDKRSKSSSTKKQNSNDMNDEFTPLLYVEFLLTSRTYNQLISTPEIAVNPLNLQGCGHHTTENQFGNALFE